jgi:uncharacterized protein (TIGR03083 family)
MSSEQPTNKTELIDRIRAGRARLERLLAPLDDAALEKPAADGWAIKDHLAHLTAWSQRAAAGIEGRPPYEGLGLDKSAEGLSEEQLNARLQARSHGRPAAELVSEFRQANDRILKLITDLPESKLFGPQADERLLGNIIGNTYEHDTEHQGWIEERLRAQATA